LKPRLKKLLLQVAGLRVGGIEQLRYPKLCGVFTLDVVHSEANGRPHYITAAGGHLYYDPTQRRWYLNTEFTPDKKGARAYIETDREVPVGEQTWKYHDGSYWAERKLTMAELSTAEVEVEEKAKAPAFAQAERVRVTPSTNSWQRGEQRVSLSCPHLSLFFVAQVAALCITGIEEIQTLCGVFTLDTALPEANDRPHYSTAAGGHLCYSVDGSWVLHADGRDFDPDKLNRDAAFETAGEVPVGEAVWKHCNVSLKDTDGTIGKWVDRKLTVVELMSAAETADAVRAVAEAATVRQWRAAGGTSAAVWAESATSPSASVESVCLWLCEEGFGHVMARSFEATGITGERLAHLDGAALQNMGVLDPVVRARLLGLHPLPALQQGLIGRTERILAEQVWLCMPGVFQL
jgi:hypothetical protein